MTDRWEERREGWSQQAGDARAAYDVDYARIIHSGSFRRLQGKTQILNLGDSDFYRTRLTHSLEVAQVASGICQHLARMDLSPELERHLAPLNLIRAIGSTHDLGHPPFGHGGEVALNYCMREHGGFEGNGQTLRVLARLENFSDRCGSNLTRRCLLGVLKYPAPYSKLLNAELRPKLRSDTSAIRIIDRDACKPPKCFLDSEADVVDWILEPFGPSDRQRFAATEARAGKHGKPKHKSLDCSIMDVADDVAYGVHDLEDAIALGLVNKENFTGHVEAAGCASFLDELARRYPAERTNDAFGSFVNGLFGAGGRRKRFIGRAVSFLINSVQVEEDAAFEHPLLRYNAVLPDGPGLFLRQLRDVVSAVVIRSPNVQQLEFKGQQMVVAVFEALSSEPEVFLPVDARAAAGGPDGVPRAVCDYVAGMTDHCTHPVTATFRCGAEAVF